jgi:hypothetical protein
MSFLNFLKEVKIEEATVKAVATRIEGKDRNPAEDFMGIRVWKNGAVYPSVALVKALKLDYQPVTITDVIVKKDGETVMEVINGQETAKTKRVIDYPDFVGFGLDVVDTANWTQYPKDQPRLLVVGVTPKNEAKVDLFGTTRYTPEGEPMADVLSQGATTFGIENLLPALEEVYGIGVSHKGYVDVAIPLEQDLSSLATKSIFLLPKKINRGKDAGKLDYERRENIAIHPLVPQLLLEANEVIEENEPEMQDAD